MKISIHYIDIQKHNKLHNSLYMKQLNIKLKLKLFTRKIFLLTN